MGGKEGASFKGKKDLTGKTRKWERQKGKMGTFLRERPYRDRSMVGLRGCGKRGLTQERGQVILKPLPTKGKEKENAPKPGGKG